MCTLEPLVWACSAFCAGQVFASGIVWRIISGVWVAGIFGALQVNVSYMLQ